MINRIALKKILSTTILILAVTLLYAQTDTMYIMKNGAVINRQAIKPTDLDSIIFYEPHQLAPSGSPALRDTMFIMKEGLVINKQALKSTDLDSIVFYDPSSTFKDVKVVFPENSQLSPSDYKLFSSAKFTDVSDNGGTFAIHNKGDRSLAFLLNAQDEPVLMGFVTDDQNEVSVASTVEVAQYLALGTAFMPEAIRNQFIEEEGLLPGTAEFVAKAENMFSTDENFLTSESFLNELKQRIDNLTKRDTLDLYNKSIYIKSGDIKSGLQVEEKDFQDVSIANTFRRRAHGFLYKTGYIDETGKKTTLINDIPQENAKAMFDIPVSPTQAIRGFTGVIQDAAGGVGINFARTSTGPIKLELGDNQLETIYQLRVVAPSVFAGRLTNVEEDKLHELEWETLSLDWALPIFLDIIGEAKLLNKIDDKNFKTFVSAIIQFAGSYTSITDPLKKGEYGTAMHELFFAMANNYTSSKVEDMLKGLIDGVLVTAEGLGKTISQNNAQLILGNVKFIFGALKVTDAALKVVDYGRILSAISNSKMVEQWEVDAKKTKVTLSPEQAVAFPYIYKYIDAIVKDTELSAGQSFAFDWSTTGKYGVLRDDVGHSSTSFSNSSTISKREVIYFSNANDADLPEDATDKIYIEAFIKETGKDPIPLGKDSATVRVRSYQYEIQPKNITVQGGTNLKMYIQRPDDSEDITNNPSLDFKIVWSTEGNYGLLEGTANSLTTYNDNQMTYFALDKDIKNGTETVGARIYGKLKDKGDEAYELYDEFQTTIKIQNDPNKKSYLLQLQNDGEWPDVPNSASITFYTYIKVPKEEKAISYQADFLKYYRGWAGNEAAPFSYSWTPENIDYQENVKDEGDYYLVFSVSVISSNSADNYAFYKARMESLSGYAQVTVTLKP